MAAAVERWLLLGPVVFGYYWPYFLTASSPEAFHEVGIVARHIDQYQYSQGVQPDLNSLASAPSCEKVQREQRVFLTLSVATNFEHCGNGIPWP